MCAIVNTIQTTCTCMYIVGMGLIAEKYPHDSERGNAMAIALSGLALGVLSEYIL